MLNNRYGWFWFVLSGLTFLTACQKTEIPKELTQEEELRPGEYRLTGEVIKKSAEINRILVQHDEIKGFMPAMTMEFSVSPGDYSMVKPGMKVRAILYRDGDDFCLKEIWPDQSDHLKTIYSVHEALAIDTEKRGFRVYRELGESVPPFALYNQDGELVTASTFSGQRIVLNFIFTRCPDANMCSLSVTKMIELQQGAKASGVEKLQLLSVSLDPEYDTPGVLNSYTVARGIDTSNYQFLAGPLAQVELLLRQLGVSRFADGSLIQHSLNTLLIDGNGELVYLEEGSDWNPDNFLERLQ